MKHFTIFLFFCLMSMAIAQTSITKHKNTQKPKLTNAYHSQLWDQADAAFEIGDYNKSIAICKKIYSLWPDDFDAYSDASWLIWSQSRQTRDEAINIATQYMKSAPQDPDRGILLANIFWAEKDYTDVIKILNPTLTKISKNKPSIQAYAQLYQSYYFVNDKPNALRIVKKALIDYPGFPEFVKREKDFSK